MKKGFLISSATMICLCLTSCGVNPQKVGEKLGQEYCDCRKDYAKEQDKVYQDFLAKFDSYGFKTRPEARQKWQDLQSEAKRKFEENKGKIDQKVQETRSKFPADASNLLDPKIQKKYLENPQKYLDEFKKNQEKARVFNDALRSAEKQCDVPDKKQDHSKIDERITTIIPQRPPDEENLKQNLVRRRITEQPGGYYGRGWAWQIASADEIKSIKIEKDEKVGDDYVLDVHLLLQKDAGQHEADLKITSVLGKNDDDWKIDFIETKDIRIVKTGRYDNCITTEITKSFGSYLQFTNGCDVALIVGGQMLENNGEWTKFSTRVNANSTGSAAYRKDYKIDFIERQ